MELLNLVLPDLRAVPCPPAHWPKHPSRFYVVQQRHLLGTCPIHPDHAYLACPGVQYWAVGQSRFLPGPKPEDRCLLHPLGFHTNKACRNQLDSPLLDLRMFNSLSTTAPDHDAGPEFLPLTPTTLRPSLPAPGLQSLVSCPPDLVCPVTLGRSIPSASQVPLPPDQPGQQEPPVHSTRPPTPLNSEPESRVALHAVPVATEGPSVTVPLSGLFALLKRKHRYTRADMEDALVMGMRRGINLAFEWTHHLPQEPGPLNPYTGLHPPVRSYASPHFSHSHPTCSAPARGAGLDVCADAAPRATPSCSWRHASTPAAQAAPGSSHRRRRSPSQEEEGRYPLTSQLLPSTSHHHMTCSSLWPPPSRETSRTCSPTRQPLTMAPTPYPTWPPTSPTHTVAGVQLRQHPRSSSSPPRGCYQSMDLPRAPAPPPSEAETSDQLRMRESPASVSMCSPPSTQRGREATPSRARSAGAPASGSSGTASGFWTTPAGPNPLQQGTLQVAPSPAGMGSAAATCEPQQQPLHATRTARPGTQMGTAGQLTFINGLLPETTSVIKRLAGNRVVHRACDQYGREADSDGCFHGPCMFNTDNFKPYDPHNIFARVVLPPSANMPPPPPRLPATTHAHAQVHEQEVRGRFNYIHYDPPRSPAGPQGAEPRPVARVLFRSPTQGVGEPAAFTAKEGPQQPTVPAPAQEPVAAAPTPGEHQPPSTRRPRKKNTFGRQQPPRQLSRAGGTAGHSCPCCLAWH